MGSKKKESIHSGHRIRLREKVKNRGLKTLSEHEILELLLTYAIPRKNTNPIAHNLINRFGSLAKVIDADYFDLSKVDGMGESSALFINVLSSVIKEYKERKAQEENVIIKTTNEAIKYFRQSFSVEGNEFMHFICLSKMGKIVSAYTFYGKDDAEIGFNFNKFLERIHNENVNSVIMFHTHPNGNVEPSYADLETTQRCVNIAMLIGVNFIDHIIFNETEQCSLDKLGYIEAMKRKSLQINSPITSIENSQTKSISSVYKEIDLSNLDLGDVSIEEKLKNKKKK